MYTSLGGGNFLFLETMHYVKNIYTFVPLFYGKKKKKEEKKELDKEKKKSNLPLFILNSILPDP